MKHHQSSAKKSLVLITVFSVLALGISFFLSGIVLGMSKVEIKGHHFDATVQDDGNIRVREEISYQLNNKNGIIRDYRYDSRKYESMKITSIKDESGKEFMKMDYATSGMKNVYVFTDWQDHQELKVFRPTNGAMTLYIEYEVTGLMKEYNDMQEIYWKFYDTKQDTLPSENVKVTINFPSSMDTEHMDLFGHGDLEGELSKTTDQLVTVEIPYFPENTFGEVRLLMPDKPLKTYAGVVDEKDYYEESYAYEIGQATLTEETIAKNKNTHIKVEIITWVIKIIQLLTTIIAIVLGWRVFNKIKKEYDTERYVATFEYSRDVAIDYGPAVAALVAHPEKKVGQEQMTAILFQLYIKKQINIDLVKLDPQKEKEVVMITVLPRTDTFLFDEEIEMYEWLANFRGLNVQFAYDEFTGNANGSKDLQASKNFMSAYHRLMSKIEVGYDKLRYRQFSARTVSIPEISFIGISVGVFVLMAIGVFLTSSDYMILLSLVLLIILMVTLMTTLNRYKEKAFIYTEKGVEENAKMLGLKKYLEDYSMLDEAMPSLVNLWEQYFVFGLSLGVTEKALKALYQKLPLSQEEVQMTFNQYYVMNRMLTYHHFNQYHGHAIQTHQGRIDAAQAASVSRTSGGSSFGGGGGFSGGGGFGSGGGGGRSF